MMVRHMCQSLEKLLLEEEKKNRAARLILTRAEENPAEQGGEVRQRLEFPSGRRQYYEELKSSAEHNPKLLQRLLETTQSLILYSDPDKGN